jgi:cystathionine beta-lyase/cystathionine gamma-synthase
VSQIEALVSGVTIPDQRLNIVWASGMSAVRESVNFAATYMADQPRMGDRPIVAYAQDLYSQSTTFFQKEKRKGVNIIRFDSGDADEVAASIDRKGADVIFAETVANTPDMPVLDVERLLDHVRSLDNPPVLIFDNTLPLSTGLRFADLLTPDDRVIVVESSTKNLMNNSDLLGISYSGNVDLMDALRKHKAHSGALNSLGGLATIAAKLEATIPGFDERNKAVFSSTNLIARALSEARTELGKDADFYTTFPSNPAHPNAALARSMRLDGSELGFVSPVVFITATDWSENGAADLIRRLAEHPAIREQVQAGQIHLGQSFGMASARILYDRNAPNVRFAGGFDLADEVALAKAIKEAATDK